MQRVRIGLTGLAGVVVLVLFAAAVLGLRSGEPRPMTTAPKDPLAELGVTPGGSGADPAPPAARRPLPAAASLAQQPAPAPARPARGAAGTPR